MHEYDNFEDVAADADCGRIGAGHDRVVYVVGNFFACSISMQMLTVLARCP